MKKIVIAIALAVFTTAAQAELKEKTWYTGTKLGWSHLKDLGFHSYYTNIEENNQSKRDQLGIGTYLGYQDNRYFGFELGYDWFGRMRYSNRINSDILEAMGIQLSANLNYPITNKVDIYTRFGGIVWNTNTKRNVDGQSYFKKHSSGVSPVYGIGIKYTISPEWETRLDYQWVNHIGDKNLLPIRPNSGILSIGVGYRLNQEGSSIVAIPAKKKSFVLQSNVLFEFNKHTLNTEGKNKLDKLYNELNNIDSTNFFVTIIGYTDHIGSISYNQALSQNRAREVMNYLISKGIQKNKITSEGYGKRRNLINNTTCDNINKTSELIHCLSKDRRVEIKIEGIRKQLRD